MRLSTWSKSSLKISHRNTISVTFEMAHNFQKNLKKSEIFTTSTYTNSILISTIKISTKTFTSWPPMRSLKDMFTFLRVLCTCELKGLGEWLFMVEKNKGWSLRRMRSQFKSSWRWLVVYHVINNESWWVGSCLNKFLIKY